jgi:hypothetical protein
MTSDFAARLDAARALLTGKRLARDELPIALADQLDAADREAQALLGRLRPALESAEPERNWRMSTGGGIDAQAILLAACLGIKALCCHLRSSGPQVVVVRLPLRRADCTACSATVRRPPADEKDRCDVCGKRGVHRFVPVSVALGQHLILGDACDRCAQMLGLSEDT